MKIRTIWTMRGMSFRERLRRTKERMVMNVAWALPQSVLYWAYINVVTRNTFDHENPSDMNTLEVLKREGVNYK